MVVNKQFRWALSALLMMSGPAAYPQDCVSALQTVSMHTVQPNVAAGPLALAVSIIGVAKNATDGSRAISFATYDLDLNQRTPDRLVVGGSYDRALSLLWNGTEFGLFYRNPGAQLALQRISVTGTAIGPAIVVAPSHGAWADSQYGFTWDAFRGLYLVVVTIPQGSDSGFRLIGVAPDGTVKIDQVLSFSFSRFASPSVAVTRDGRIGIVWGYSETANGSRLSFLTLDSKNNYSVATLFGSDALSPRIATDDSQFAIVWSAPKTGGGTELHWLRGSAAGAIITPEKTLLAGKGVDVAPVWLVWNGSRGEWALSYLDAIAGLRVFPPELRLRRFGTDGTSLGDTLFSSDSTKNLLVTPYPFVYAGRRYVTSIERFFSNTEGSESYLVGNCPLSAAIAVDNAYPAPNTTVTFDAIVSAGVQPLSYFWDFGDRNGTATEKSPRHTFIFAGDYTVTLTTTDANQGVARATYVVHVGGTPPPPPCTQPPSVVTPRADRTLALIGDPVTFGSPFDETAPYSYSWSFGDGSSAAGPVVTHRFMAAGIYSVTLTLTATGPSTIGGCAGFFVVPLQVRVVAAARRRLSR